MKVRKFTVPNALSPYVKEFIVIESDTELLTNTIPDTSLVMAFRYRGEVKKMEGDKKEILPASTAAGLRKTARQFNYISNTANLLVIFKEGGFAAFSKIPAHELFTLNISSDNIFPASELNEILELLAEAGTDKLRIRIIETFLISKLNDCRIDPLVTRAVELIKKQNGIVRIKELASSLNISQDPFEKRFRALIGATPKQFASIIRLRHLIKNYPTYSSLTEASHEAGYFDQSHFIKDFRLFTGKSPKAFLKDQNFW